jgi:hypothetical protein
MLVTNTAMNMAPIFAPIPSLARSARTFDTNSWQISFLKQQFYSLLQLPGPFSNYVLRIIKILDNLISTVPTSSDSSECDEQEQEEVVASEQQITLVQ